MRKPGLCTHKIWISKLNNVNTTFTINVGCMENPECWINPKQLDQAYFGVGKLTRVKK